MTTLNSLTRYLRGAELRTLSCGSSPSTAYRLFYFPPFTPSLIIETAKHDGDWETTVVSFAPQQTASQKVQDRLKQRNRDSDVQALVRQLDRANVWHLSPSEERSVQQDGTIWVIEARADSLYRVVVRSTPVDKEIEDAGREFFRLAGIAYPNLNREPDPTRFRLAN